MIRLFLFKYLFAFKFFSILFIAGCRANVSEFRCMSCLALRMDTYTNAIDLLLLFLCPSKVGCVVSLLRENVSHWVNIYITNEFISSEFGQFYGNHSDYFDLWCGFITIEVNISCIFCMIYMYEAAPYFIVPSREVDTCLACSHEHIFFHFLYFYFLFKPIYSDFSLRFCI